MTDERNALTEAWRLKLEAAQDAYRLAKAEHAVNHLDHRAMPMADGQFATRRALKKENVTLAEYRRCLQIFYELTVNGKRPPE